MNSVKINCGIGDILLSRAILDGQQGVMGVSLGEDAAAEARNAAYLPFARWLFDTTFAGFGPADADAPRLDPQALCRLTGLLPRWPRVPRHRVPGNTIVVTTKVRGLPRRIYETFRSDFACRIARLATRHNVLLVGEKEIGWNKEYDHHGHDLVYSIYGDLFQIPNVRDLTIDELGVTPPTPEWFNTDMYTMASANRVVTIGTGGNTTMAMAVGRCWSFVGHSEMEPFFAQMPWRPGGCFMTDNIGDFLEGL